MAYQTGGFTSAADLLSTMETFAVARGWTLNTSAGTGGDPANSQVSLESDGLVVNIIPLNTTAPIGWRAQPSTAFINNSTNFEDHTGSPNTSGATNTTVQMTLINGAGVAYHLFGNDASPRYIHVVAEVTSGVYSHFSFGTIIKVGSWTGGGYVTGLGMSATVVNQSHYPFSYDNNTTNGTQWMRVDNLVGLGSPGYRQEWGSFETAEVAEPMVNDLWKSGLDTQTQRSLLAPIFAVAETTEGAPVGAGIFLGTVQDVRLISMDGRTPGEQLVIGGDTWHVFPLRQKSSQSGSNAYVPAGTAPNFHTALCGLAYLET